MAEDAMRAANEVSYEHDAVSHYCDRIWQASHDARSRAAFELKKAEKDMEAYDRDLKELEGLMEAEYQRKMNA
jgi:flagellar motility protein MotE (MotC chaperone)